MLGQDTEYVALSHCWGTLNQFQTTTMNIENMKRNIDWGCLPKTFKDAIATAQSLGFGYIWIDSLCILQDSRQDWEIESSQMGLIYENAALTIAATSSPSDETGFLGTRTIPATGVVDFSFGEEDACTRPTKVYIRQVMDHYKFNLYADTEPAEGRLSSRAWAFQERLLARRVLAYHKDELFWECNTTWDCECGHNSFAPQESQRAHPFNLQETLLSINANPSYLKWRSEIVPAYSSRSLTFRSDRLPAISAVVSKLQHTTGDDYFCALWKSELPRQLLWQRVGSWSSKEPTATLDYQAPSFSWASVEAVVGYLEFESFQPLINVLETSCHLSGLNPMGKVSYAHIRVSGLLARCWICTPPKPYFTIRPRLCLKDTYESSEEIDFNYDTLLKIGDITTASGQKTRGVQKSHDLPVTSELDKVTDSLVRTWEVLPVWCLYVGEGKIDEDFYRDTFQDENVARDNGREQIALILGLSPGRQGACERIGITNKRENERRRPGNWEMLVSTATKADVVLV